MKYLIKLKGSGVMYHSQTVETEGDEEQFARDLIRILARYDLSNGTIYKVVKELLRQEYVQKLVKEGTSAA